MKTVLSKSLALTILCFLTYSVMAQDRIYKKNQDVIECKVIEIGEEEIKYTKEETADLVYVMDKDRIEKIVFETGKEMIFAKRMYDPETYAGQKKTAWKMGFLSPLTSLNVGYERALKPGRSIEGNLGFIGLGITEAATTYNPAGAYLKTGYKFIMSPDFELKGMKYSHVLTGFYFKPEFSFAYYDRDFESYYYDPQTGNYTWSTKRKSVFAGALMLNFGKQWVMSDAFLVDLFVGVGYGGDNVTGADYGHEGYENTEYHYGFILGGEVPLAGTAGFRIGFLTK